jgi:hypothetical protein
VDHTAALDAAVDVRDADAATREASRGGFWAAREGSAAGRAGWHDELDLVGCERQEAAVLEPPTARGYGLGSGSRHPLVGGTTRRGRTQAEEGQHGVEPPPMVDRVARGLAAIIARRLRRIVGTPAAPCAALRPNRGEAGTGAAAGAGGSDGFGGACTGTTSALASVSVTPRRFASAGTDRVGASPNARRVACRTVHQT